MATSVEGRIWAALQGRLQTMYGELDTPFAWPNRDFTKPDDGKYLRVNFIPNTAERRFIGSTDPHRFIGLLQISVCWPKNVFLEPALEMAGTVAGYFPADLRMTSEGVTVRIQKHGDVGPMLVEDTGVLIPVTVAYEAWG